MYPDRPIRPLPKRRLRARLSPEQAESIIFPPAPPISAPLFSFPYNQSSAIAGRQQRGEHEHTCNCGHEHSELESEEDEDERAAALQSSPSLPQYTRNLMGAKAAAGMASNFSKPSSTSSSADGYESFENTNNKKKRKIPNMGGASTHHTNLSAEMASMGISGHPRDVSAHEDGDGGVGHYYGSGSSAMQTAPSGTGISGAGRGRYARSSGRTPERRVLGTSTNALNAGKTSGSKRDYNGGGTGNKAGGSSDQGGIISTAIANAQAAQSQVGNENVSMLQQQAAKAHPNKTQFTFTCGSDSANKMVWPGQQNVTFPPIQNDPRADRSWHPSSTTSGVPPPTQIPVPNHHGRRTMATQGTQTSPNMDGTQQAGLAGKNQPQQQGQNTQQGAPQPRKPRRSPSKAYAMAARQRRLQTEYANFHNKPKREDIWICEFCEYESIFGSPPKALVMQYEIKARKERKRAAEKQRLLEKARMRNRKGKKGGKAAAKNNANNNQQNQNPPPDQKYDQPLDDSTVDNQEEEYYDDEFDDLPALVPTPNAATGPNGNYADNHQPPIPTTVKDARGSGKAAVNGA